MSQPSFPALPGIIPGKPLPPPYYAYAPSTDAAIIAACLFALSTLIHTYQLLRTRVWFFVPIFIGGCFEVFGFICRYKNAQETPYWDRMTFQVMTLGILLAPTFFAASIYMEFGRVMLLAGGDHKSFIRRKFLTPIFVVGDILSFAIQAIGMLYQRKS